jgi:hypothetical protein
MQSDENVKTAVGMTVHPNPAFTLRFYYDFSNKTITESTLSSFVSYSTNQYRISYEFNRIQNRNSIPGNHLQGMSVYGTLNLNKKWEVFGRYDRLSSSMDDNTELPWNIYEDGSAVITGVQYLAHNNVKLSLNYRDWYSYAKNGTDRSYLYLNLEFRL